MSDPLISVIVPVYKVERYLERCVNSICNQTYTNLEIILVNDGSPDRCGEICDAFARKDSRIHVFHKENGGQASARNLGLSVAKGEWIGFVDSDDTIASNMYEKLLEIADTYDADIVCCGIERVDDNGHLSYFNDQLDDLLVLNRVDAFQELIQNYRITNAPVDKLYHKNVFEDVRMLEGMIYEDFEVMPRVLVNASKVVYTGDPLYYYYMSPNSTMRAAFSPRQFDVVKASLLRLKTYETYCPQHLLAAKVNHVDICLGTLYEASKEKQCSSLAKELRDDLLRFLSENTLSLRKEVKLKCAVLRFGNQPYRLFMQVCYFGREKMSR